MIGGLGVSSRWSLVMPGRLVQAAGLVSRRACVSAEGCCQWQSRHSGQMLASHG
jgi:hypothetical protein